MMSNVFTYIFFLSFILQASLISAQPHIISIDGKVNYPQEKGKIILVKVDFERDQHQVLETVKLDEQGKFSIQISEDTPSVYVLSFYRKQQVILALEKDQKLDIVADGNNRNGFLKVEGSKDTDLLLQYNRLQEALGKQHLSELAEQYQQAATAKNQKKIEEVSAKYEQKFEEVRAELQKFVLDKMGTSIAAYAANINWDTDKDLEFMERLVQKFKKERPGLEVTQGVQNKIKRFKSLSIGAVAPEIVQNTPEGNEIKLSSFRGKYVLIDFWASWCGPCRRENPNVVRVYEKYKEKGFAILGVSLDNNKEKWMKAIEKDQLTWVQISDLKGWAAAPAKLYNVTSIPTNYLLDKEGRIIAKNLRGAQLEAKVAEIFGETEK